MPEEGLETQELKDKLDEAREQALGGEERANRWTLWLSLSTAIIAVLAAVASLEAGTRANEAIDRKDDAILAQSQADDAWAHYQAASIKAVVYATQAESARPDLAARWREEADRERKSQSDLKTNAERAQDQVKDMSRDAGHSLHVHHLFAKSVTVFQVSIALAAIAALTRRKAMWWISLATGAAGAWAFAAGLLA